MRDCRLGYGWQKASYQRIIFFLEEGGGSGGVYCGLVVFGGFFETTSES